MMEVTVPNAEKLERDLGLTRAQLLADLKREVKKVIIDVSAGVKDKKLSGQVLKVQTGRLRRSVNYRTDETETGIEALAGTNVSYGRTHEFGFDGTVNVKAHVRRIKQRFDYQNWKPRRGKTQVNVRAHTREVHLPERSFLRSTLREMRPGIESRIARVVASAIARRNGGEA